MTEEKQDSRCQLCGMAKKTQAVDNVAACSTCRAVMTTVKNHPEVIKKAWLLYHDEPILPQPGCAEAPEPIELPDVVDGKRYRAVDREQNKWYLSVSEVDDNPVEVFASTAFDRNHELQSRISNLTTITRLISLILRHIFLHEPLTLDKCLKQIQRSSRQKNDLPDMLYGVLARYRKGPEEADKNPLIM
ncbi:MAG: TSCPD domain-containing protein [Desulfobulbaceae bacterium]